MVLDASAAGPFSSSVACVVVAPADPITGGSRLCYQSSVSPM